MNNEDAQRTDLLTVAQCAHYAAVHHTTVRRWIRRGELRAIKLGSEPQSPVRVTVADLIARLRVVRPSTREEA